MVQVKEPGFFSRGKITLPLRPDITPDALVAELKNAWGGKGYDAYKTALLGADVVLKKSGWTGLALKINHSAISTEILYNAFSPSALVRILAMGLIPLLIVKANSWNPLLAEWKVYVTTAPYFTGQQLAGAAPAGMLPQGQPGAYPQQQPGAYPQQPGAYPQQQPGAYPQQQQPGYPQQQPGYPPQQPPPGGYNPQGGGGQWQ